MKNLLSVFVVILLSISISNAQETAMPITGTDCNGQAVDLFSDLDAGKLVILHFFMPNCGSCPPIAKKIQTMTNNINKTHPGMVKGYAFPFQNSTTCSYSQSWITSNSLSGLYLPMSKGAEQVAYYGGFGMPTVVLLGGGVGHKVLFVTQSFSTSDTAMMSELIMKQIVGTSDVKDLAPEVSSFGIFPNPSTSVSSIKLTLNQEANVVLDVIDLNGKYITTIAEEKMSGEVSKEFNVAELATGKYLVRLKINGRTMIEKISVIH